MIRSTRYYTLIGSLPALPRRFDEVEGVPISQLRLEERLKMLEPHDAEVIEKMSEFLAWERQPLERTDEDIVRHYQKFTNETGNRFARELIAYIMAIRTVLAGLRCRRLQQEPPPGVPTLAAQMSRNWNHPDFGLGTQFPWIAAVDEQLKGDSPFELERMRIDLSWRRARRLSEGYFFTFEAVLLYLIRWDLVDRWTQRDAQAGQQKFEQLVTDAMGDYAHMFAGTNDAGRQP